MVRILGWIAAVTACVPVLAKLDNTIRIAKPTVRAEAYTWKNAQIVGGGFVSGIITHPKAKGVMYARTDIGGAYRFDPGGRRWIPITDWVSASEWTYTGIESIAVDPSDPETVYLAAGTYTNNWSPQNGAIFRSHDRGNTWQKTPLPFKNGGNEDGRSIGERLAVDPNRGSILYFGTRNNGLWRSGDSGVTWEQVTTFPVTGKTNGIGIGFVLFDGSTGTRGHATRTLYAGVAAPGPANLYRSVDAGKSWAALSGQPQGLLPHHGAFDRDGVLYLTYGNAPGPNGVSNGAVWRYATRTGVWTEITPVKPGQGDGFGYAGLSLDARRPGTLVVTSLDRWSHGDDVWRSTDGGRNWTALRANNVRSAEVAPHYGGKDGKDFGHWMGCIQIDPFDSDHAMYVTGMGIWATDDLTAADHGQPTHWYPGAVGIEECVVNDVISPPAGAPLLCATWDIGGFRHEDLDHSPRTGSFGWGRNVSLDYAELKPDVVVRLHDTHKDGTGGGAYSLDNGITWTEFPVSPGGDGTAAVAADGMTFVVTDHEGIQRYSRDHGASWTKCAGLAQGARVVSDRADPTRFYAVEKGVCYVSTDGGATFSSHPVSGIGDGLLRAVPGEEGHLWLAAGDGLFRSTDAGTTFTRIAGVESAERIGFGKAAEGASYPALYLIGNIAGVHGFYRSDNQGAEWVRINDDRHQFGSINAITGDPRVYGRVYLASANRGVLYGDINKK